MQKLFFFIAFLAALAVADEIQVYLNAATPEETAARVKELERLRSSSQGLNSGLKSDLDQLWERATKIAELNDRCREISLNTAIDPTCDNFYKVELPKFEEDFYKVTGEIRLNAAQFSQSMKDKRQMIEECFESFPLLQMSPRDVFLLNGSIDAEPTKKGIDVEFVFNLATVPNERWRDNSRSSALLNSINTWMSICEPYIYRQGEPGRLAPLFDEKLHDKTENKGEWFELQIEKNSTTGEEIIYTSLRKDVWITYIVNDKKLFEVKAMKGTKFARVVFSNRENRLYLYVPQLGQNNSFIKIYGAKTTNVQNQTEFPLQGHVKYKSELETLGLKGDLRYTDKRVSLASGVDIDPSHVAIGAGVFLGVFLLILIIAL